MSEPVVLMKDPTILHDHPINAAIYTHREDDEWRSFLASIMDNGIIQPLTITSGDVILSGHRRKRAAITLKLGTVPCVVRDVSADRLEDVEDIIHSNRYRTKTFSEMMKESEWLLAIEKSRASERQGARTDLGAEVEEAGQSRDKVGEALGVSGRTFDKMRQVWAMRENPNVAAAIAKVDRGDARVESAYQTVLELKRTVNDFNARVYDMWAFGGLDARYGLQNHPGAIPGDIVENVLWYYTREGDLVVDPFAGGGVTIDVCKAWKRRCLAFDIAPVRDDITKHDIKEGFPESCRNADLCFADPPYWSMLREEYSPDSVSSLSLDEFTRFIEKFADDAYATVRLGGVLVWIIMRQTFRLPEGVEMIDWPFICANLFIDAGFAYANRITNVWPTSIWGPSQVILAKELRKVLPICGDMLVMRKVR